MKIWTVLSGIKQRQVNITSLSEFLGTLCTYLLSCSLHFHRQPSPLTHILNSCKPASPCRELSWSPADHSHLGQCQPFLKAHTSFELLANHPPGSLLHSTGPDQYCLSCKANQTTEPCLPIKHPLLQVSNPSFFRFCTLLLPEHCHLCCQDCDLHSTSAAIILPSL